MTSLLHFGSAISSVEFEYSWRLVAAALLGIVLGFERSLSGKHAGMRTYALVSLGSCLFVITGIIASFQLSIFSTVNPLTIGSNVVVAIGFLGVGLTVFRGDHPVELTTAAGLWVSAAVGLTCGFGLYVLAITATVLSLIIFALFSKLEYRLRIRYGVDGREK
jgi:putative Mg2+ transporter-C (MgtC) family protein